jgi:hypothetical protein
MISRKGLDGLIDDYTAAAGHVNDAATAMENASVLIVAVPGEQFVTDSVRAIELANTLYAAITALSGRLHDVTPND